MVWCCLISCEEECCVGDVVFIGITENPAKGKKNGVEKNGVVLVMSGLYMPLPSPSPPLSLRHLPSTPRFPLTHDHPHPPQRDTSLCYSPKTIPTTPRHSHRRGGTFLARSRDAGGSARDALPGHSSHAADRDAQLLQAHVQVLSRLL